MCSQITPPPWRKASVAKRLISSFKGCLLPLTRISQVEGRFNLIAPFDLDSLAWFVKISATWRMSQGRVFHGYSSTLVTSRKTFTLEARSTWRENHEHVSSKSPPYPITLGSWLLAILNLKHYSTPQQWVYPFPYSLYTRCDFTRRAQNINTWTCPLSIIHVSTEGLKYDYLAPPESS